jgi:hypothetical protein
MNERIETLAKAVGYDMINKAAMRALGFDVEKFAELIVGECMACSSWVGRANTTAIEPMHTAHAINQRITEHFELTKT